MHFLVVKSDLTYLSEEVFPLEESHVFRRTKLEKLRGASLELFCPQPEFLLTFVLETLAFATVLQLMYFLLSV